MFNLSYDEIVNKIKEEKKVSDQEIENRVKEKLELLSDMISKEGAAHIVANDLGVNLFKDLEQRKIRINKLNFGMRSVDVVGKVIKIYGVREFKKENREGKVANFLIGDETGVIRVVLWDVNHIKEIENNNLKENDIVKIKHGYVRDNNSFKELHVGNQGGLFINPEKEFIGEIKKTGDFERKEIKDLKFGENNVTIFGTIVQIFEPRFYNICELCGKKVRLENEKNICNEHGLVKGKFAPVLNLILDDGSDSIRVVSFREQVEKILKLNEDSILEFKYKPEKFDETKTNLLGEQVVINGRVTRNEMFDRLEFTAQRVLDVDVVELIQKTVKNLEV
ncbi:MAG: OB-fold nucleic acid binding domain-containing protein [Candidatus Woesearchaeota archaeon]